MFAAQTKTESRPSLGRKRGHGVEAETTLIWIPSYPSQPSSGTNTHNTTLFPIPWGPWLLGWEDRCALSPTCSCR